MNKFFYSRLAATNIKKNARAQIPFIITSVLTVAMFYILLSLSRNDGLKNMKRGGTVMPVVLNFGCWIIGIFAVIFLFYTYSFLMKRRQKEFGLFNILGMEKKHIAKIIAIETLYTALISIVAGLIIGLLFEKLMYMLLLRILDMSVSFEFQISLMPILITVVFFAGIFVLLFLYSMFRVRLTNPIELLHGGQVGEKEPKTKILMAIIGLVCLGIGYYLSISTNDAYSIFNMFFIAVIFVIIGTYFLFVAGSIALLKLMRKNKKYYYKTNHFISVSGMLYRMKKNAVGLANICILSTMVLVMLSTTLSMMIGLDDTLNLNYPYDIILHSYSESDMEDEKAYVGDVLDKKDMAITAEKQYKFIPYMDNLEETDSVKIIRVIPVSDYNRCCNKNSTLNNDEMLLYTNMDDYTAGRENFLDKDYTVVERLKTIDKAITYNINSDENSLIYIVSDEEFADIDKRLANYYNSEEYLVDTNIEYSYLFNMSGSDKEKLAVYDECVSYLDSTKLNYGMASRADEKAWILSVYGSLFFIAAFLGTLFVGAMILIIYYKQLSEGYEDRERFNIMQKVGLSYAETKKAIRSQILTVFFLPLMVAGVHVAFAFPMIARMLSLMTLSDYSMRLDNVQLYIWCTVGCFLVFAVLYSVIYILTAKAYYRIVKQNASR